jgi:hypothetical protein
MGRDAPRRVASPINCSQYFVRRSLMNHMPIARNALECALPQLVVQPSRLAGRCDDLIIFACNNANWHG